MKVVLFCGGLGMRLREYSENVPKPMVPIGHHPILWQVMKYYAYYGHTDFILCLGYRAHAIKEYFLNYNEAVSNDFTLTDGGRNVQLLSSDIQNWSITFVDTGLTSNIGQRLKAVEPFLDGEETFLANYTDGLTDLPLPLVIDHFHRSSAIGCFVAVRPTQTFHHVSMGPDGTVQSIKDVHEGDLWINGGYFVFKHEIFDYIHPGDELVHEPFQRLIQISRLTAYQYDGFWSCMDTFKEKQQFDDMYSRGQVPWEVWRKSAPRVG